MSELRETLELLERPLTPKEESTIKWLLGWDRETVDTMDGLLMAMWKAGRFDSPSNKGEAARLHEELEDQRARANIAHRDSLEKSERMAELRAALVDLLDIAKKVNEQSVCMKLVFAEKIKKAEEALSSTEPERSERQ